MVREVFVETASWTYSATDQSIDEALGLVQFEVAQMSARFGAGRSAWVSFGL
jgi:hypothetical protein